jgi:hypothetical protein
MPHRHGRACPGHPRQHFKEIIPLRVGSKNKPHLPGARPMLHILFSLNGASNIVISFEIDKSLQTVGPGEPLHGTFAMLCDAPDKIIRDTHIKRAVRTVGENVIVCRHAWMIPFVDGRDKPGHDGW